MMGAGPWGERWRHVSGRTGLAWQMRLRWALLVPWTSRWNAWVRDWTARLEGFASSEDQSTERERTFTESDVIQIVGYLSAELDALHSVEAPLILEAATRAMAVVAPPRYHELRSE